MLDVTVEDIMGENPIKIKESVSIKDVNHLLLRYRINGILVVEDSNDMNLVGIFTTTDSLRLMDEVFSKKIHKLEELEKISKMPVGKVARKEIIKLSADMKITKAIAIMHKNNVHTLPVYDGDKLVGVIGRHDLLNIGFS